MKEAVTNCLLLLLVSHLAVPSAGSYLANITLRSVLHKDGMNFSDNCDKTQYYYYRIISSVGTDSLLIGPQVAPDTEWRKTVSPTDYQFAIWNTGDSAVIFRNQSDVENSNFTNPLLIGHESEQVYNLNFAVGLFCWDLENGSPGPGKDVLVDFGKTIISSSVDLSNHTFSTDLGYFNITLDIANQCDIDNYGATCSVTCVPLESVPLDSCSGYVAECDNSLCCDGVIDGSSCSTLVPLTTTSPTTASSNYVSTASAASTSTGSGESGDAQYRKYKIVAIVLACIAGLFIILIILLIIAICCLFKKPKPKVAKSETRANQTGPAPDPQRPSNSNRIAREERQPRNTTPEVVYAPPWQSHTVTPESLLYEGNRDSDNTMEYPESINMPGSTGYEGNPAHSLRPATSSHYAYPSMTNRQNNPEFFQNTPLVWTTNSDSDPKQSDHFDPPPQSYRIIAGARGEHYV